MSDSTINIRDESRVAADTIRGFLAQILVCANRWIDLPEGHLLVVEGNEDIDIHVVAGDGTLELASEESIKHLAGKLSARSTEVVETFANFIAAFVAHHKNGVPCTLIFTTTASQSRQQLRPGKVQSLDFDILLEWALYLASDPAAVQSDALFANVVRAIGAKLDMADPAHANLLCAIRYVVRHALCDAFLRSVTWNFGSASIPMLQEELVEKLTMLEGGNVWRANIAAESVLARLWQAASKSELASRTLSSVDLENLRNKVAKLHEHWVDFEAMASFTSWVSWRADHYTISVVEGVGDAWSCMVVGVNFLPARDEGILAAVIAASSVDPVVRKEARTDLARGDVLRAFSLDPTFRVRLLDALRNTTITVYATVVRSRMTKDLARELVARRARRPDRDVADVAANERALELISPPRERRVMRAATVHTTTVVAELLGAWHCENDHDAKMMVRWIAPRVKLFRDSEGEYHRGESEIWKANEP